MDVIFPKEKLRFVCGHESHPLKTVSVVERASCGHLNLATTKFVIASIKCHLIQPVRNVTLIDVKREKVVYVRGKQA
ncbi:hypothetical protein RM407_004393 [Enterobacter kobei]|nr:hypothetical protein [Enterobacter kobei]